MFLNNLQGIAIGNGILNFRILSEAKIRFTEGFGLSGESSRHKIVKCCEKCLEMCTGNHLMHIDDVDETCGDAVSSYLSFV